MNSNVGLILELLAALAFNVVAIFVDRAAWQDQRDLFDMLILSQAMREGRSVQLVREEYLGVDDDGQLIENPDLATDVGWFDEFDNAASERIRARVMAEADAMLHARPT